MTSGGTWHTELPLNLTLYHTDWRQQDKLVLLSPLISQPGATTHLPKYKARAKALLGGDDGVELRFHSQLWTMTEHHNCGASFLPVRKRDL